MKDLRLLVGFTNIFFKDGEDKMRLNVRFLNTRSVFIFCHIRFYWSIHPQKIRLAIYSLRISGCNAFCNHHSYSSGTFGTL